MELSMKVTDERLNEVCECINGWYGTIITPEILEKHITDATLIVEIYEDTYSDTCVRERIIDAIVRPLVGMEWPINADSSEYSQEFFAKAKAAGLMADES